MKPGIYVVKMFYGEDKLHLVQRDENAHWKMFGGTLRFSNQQGWADNDVAENVLAGPFTPEQIAALPRLVDACRGFIKQCELKNKAAGGYGHLEKARTEGLDALAPFEEKKP